jgi:aryl-alcohol dehydrogenase-like predicted oxidoreductase
LGVWRGQRDRLLGEIMSRNSGKRIYAASSPSSQRPVSALPEYKYRDVFSAEHVFKSRRHDPKQLRVDTIDLLQFHVGRFWTAGEISGQSRD